MQNQYPNQSHNTQHPPQYYVPQNQPNQDESHLKTLSICYYIYGGLCCFAFLMMLLWLSVVPIMMDIPRQEIQGPEFEMVTHAFSFFIIMMSVMSVVVLAIAIMSLLTGSRIKTGRSYKLVFATACVVCISVPFGTALGVFTFIVLNRPSVKAKFGVGPKH